MTPPPIQWHVLDQERGFFTPDGQWVGETEHTTRDSAAGRVHWLNGGEDGK